MRILLLICAALIFSVQVRAEDLIGNGENDSVMYTDRKTWDRYYDSEALDKEIYRLGDDLVLFVGRKASGASDALIITSANQFSRRELKRFSSSEKRADIPPRDHQLFSKLPNNKKR